MGKTQKTLISMIFICCRKVTIIFLSVSAMLSLRKEKRILGNVPGKRRTFQEKEKAHFQKMRRKK